MRLVHKRKNRRYVRIVVFLLLILSVTFIQGGSKSKKVRLNEKFKNISKEMKDYYDNGELNRIIELFTNECCETVKIKKKKAAIREKREFKKVKDSIRAEIYEWTALSYIALDRPEKGDIYIKKLLVLKREEGIGDYWLSIRNIAQKYDVAPRLLVGFRIGPNFTLAHPVNRFRVFETDPAAENISPDKKYLFHMNQSQGLQWNIILEYALTKNLSISLQPAACEMLFRYKNLYRWKGEGNITQIEAVFNHRQRLNYVEIPLLLTYRFTKGKLKPYVQIGGFFSILYLAHKSIDLDITQKLKDRQELINEKEIITDIFIMKQLKNYHAGFLVGGGISIDTGFKGLRVGIEMNYKQGLNNIVDEDHRYSDHKIIYGYYDVFDDMKLSTLDLTVKVLLPVSFKAFKR